MVYSDPEYRTRRPLKISVLGASGVGKTTIALQYVTNQVSVETAPTTIEDVFRKESRITVTDTEILHKIQSDVKNKETERECLLEEPFNKADDTICRNLDSADISLSLKITDTAGYMPEPKDATNTSRRFLSRITLKRKPEIIKPIIPPNMSLDSKSRTRTSSSVNLSVRIKDRHATSMMSSDGIILVYNVLDDRTFAVAREIRNRFVQMHLTNCKTSRKAKGNHPQKNLKKKRFGFCRKRQIDDVDIPPIFLVGTHADIRVEKIETSSQFYDISFLRPTENKGVTRQVGRKRKVAKTLNDTGSSVYPHDVYPVISEWKECAGFAEITYNDTGIVKQIFEQLNLAIVTPKDEY